MISFQCCSFGSTVSFGIWVTAFTSITIVEMIVGDSGYFKLEWIGTFCDGFVWQTRIASIRVAQLASIHLCPELWSGFGLFLFSQVGHGHLDPTNAVGLPWGHGPCLFPTNTSCVQAQNRQEASESAGPACSQQPYQLLMTPCLGSQTGRFLQSQAWACCGARRRW